MKPAPEMLHFLRARYLVLRKTHVVVGAMRNPDGPEIPFATGQAIPNGGWDVGLRLQHLIRVYSPRGRRYPYRQRNGTVCDGRTCPAITLQNLTEELLIVIAHEAAHLKQYEKTVARARCVPGRNERTEDIVEDLAKDLNLEIDAELSAVKSLKAWRAR